MPVKANPKDLVHTFETLFTERLFSPRPTARAQALTRERNCGRVDIRVLDAQDAAGLLKLKRGHWGIESRLQHALDVTPGEDRSRGRQPAAAFVLSLFRRRVVSCARGWITAYRARKPKSLATTRQSQKRFSHHDGGPAFRQ